MKELFINYPKWSWDKPSKALIVNLDKQHLGHVVCTVGPAVNCEMESVGNCLEDLPFDTPVPMGLSVWEGFYKYYPGPPEYPTDGDSYLEGTFCQPTDEEWEFIKRGECPWDDKEWRSSPMSWHFTGAIWEHKCPNSPPQSGHYNAEKVEEGWKCTACGELRKDIEKLLGDGK